MTNNKIISDQRVRQNMQTMQNNAVQERIKRMMKEKKMAKQSQSQIRKRVVSQNCFEENDISVTKRQNQEDQMSIRTEWRKRNTGTQKYRQTENSENTTIQTSRQSNRVEVQKIVGNIFSHSPKLTQYLEQSNMRKEEAMNELMANQLFVLSLGTKLSKLSNVGDNASTMNGIAENQIILKLSKINRKKKQSLSCYDIQNRITSLINKRLDLLKKY